MFGNGFQLVGLSAVVEGTVQLLHIMSFLELLDSTFYFALIKQLYGLLCQRIYLALVDAGKQVGIFIHVLAGTLQFLVGLIKGGLLLLQLDLSFSKLFFQFGNLTVILLLGLSLTNSYQVLFLPFKLVCIAEYQHERFLAHTPLIDGLLVEHHHFALPDRHQSDAVAHLSPVQGQGKSTIVFVAYRGSLVCIVRNGDLTQSRALIFTVILIGYAVLGDGLCRQRYCCQQ